MKKLLLFATLLLLGYLSIAQQATLTNNAEISIITVAPGNNLVDSFGHSAIRVNDNSIGVDYAFNYGTYDFNAPNFYGNFAKGKLLYILSVSRFSDFLRYYSNQNRSVKEQVLNLTLQEKQEYFNYLRNNAKLENRGYLYDFFYDNCATKLRDVTQDVLKNSVEFDYGFANNQNYTMRGLIHKYSKTQPWGTFGIDLALGSIIDKKAIPEAYIFLPDYTFEAFKSAQIISNNHKPLVAKTNFLFKSESRKNPFTFTPLLFFSILAILIAFITYKNYKNKKRSKWLNFTLFFITGLAGIIMMLLWFATDHTTTAYNYNILWAFAPNFVVAFYLLKKETPNWISKYSMLLIVLLVLTILLWVFKVQEFNLAVIPILLLLFIRYVFLSKA